MAEVTLDDNMLRMMLRSRETSDYLLSVAQEVAAAAQGLARSEAYLYGYYMNSIVATTAGMTNGLLAGRIQSDDMKAGWIEFGGGSFPTKAIIRRACEQVTGVTATAPGGSP